MTMSIEPTTATLGATVRGVDLQALNETDWAAILAAFHRHALLIFPGQGLSAAAQAGFARRFGDIEVLVQNLDTIPISNRGGLDGAPLADDSFHMQLLRGNEGWHTDSSYMPLAAKASVLSAQVVPATGGETEWADMRAAYDALDAERRAFVDGHRAYHNYFYSQARIGHAVQAGQAYGFYEGEPPLRELVKIHPVTGRRALFIGRHACDIPGLERAESERVLDELTAFACQPPRTWTHHWQPGDVVVWDNRCLLHRARPYDHRQTRIMLHTRVRGDAASEAALNAAA
ncbi:MAG: TauD/TfdA family dioxygenase [Gammaproteobacteria bacterium]|nr:TauD/TfdA family dioxygenase [Gammaproteobacteria bacterium]